mmetsp:Transcript_16885/g.55252  ORF Transcript_16885/g.55252 Transcript_16885/m.55252 type:complete len:268 (-) Transcript_16885:559-1362(-)
MDDFTPESSRIAALLHARPSQEGICDAVTVPFRQRENERYELFADPGWELFSHAKVEQAQIQVRRVPRNEKVAWMEIAVDEVVFQEHFHVALNAERANLKVFVALFENVRLHQLAGLESFNQHLTRAKAGDRVRASDAVPAALKVEGESVKMLRLYPEISLRSHRVAEIRQRFSESQPPQHRERPRDVCDELEQKKVVLYASSDIRVRHLDRYLQILPTLCNAREKLTLDCSAPVCDGARDNLRAQDCAIHLCHTARRKWSLVKAQK